MGAFAVACASMLIVDVLRPVYADADSNLVTPKEIAPMIINQGGVGLDSVVNVDALRTPPFDDPDRLRIIIGRQCQGLAGMPDDIEILFEQMGIEDQARDFLDRGKLHGLTGIGAVRQVAISAVDITETCRLKDHQTNRTSYQHRSLA